MAMFYVFILHSLLFTFHFSLFVLHSSFFILHSYLVRLHQSVHYGIDGKARDGAYAEFLDDVLPVADDRCQTDVKLVGYLLIYISAHDKCKHLHFAWRQAEVVTSLFVDMWRVGMVLVPSFVQL